jgi:ribonuclease HI
MMEFDITYVPQKAIKGQALADFLAAHSIPDNSPLVVHLPDEEAFVIDVESPWELYIDEASRTKTDPNGAQRRRAGAGLVFKTPQGETIYYSFSLLKEKCSNNETKYEALIFGLLLALSMDIRNLPAYGDSQLIVRQVNDVYEVRKPELVPYYNVVQRIMNKFEHINIIHILRGKNASADALAKLAAALVLPDGEPAQIKIEEKWLLPAVLELVLEEYEVDHVLVMAVEVDDWRKPFLDYFNHGTLPNDPVERRCLQQRLPSYIQKAGVLYRRSFGHGILLCCVSRKEADQILLEMHKGVCGGHQSGAKMYHSIKLVGYYWPRIMSDCLKIAKSYHNCQIHDNFKHLPPVPLHPTVPTWPFDAWGIDVIGAIEPPSAWGHHFILAATDYFSKWAEAIPLREVKSDNVINFLERHIIYRFEAPRRITSDNAKAFKSNKMQRFIAKYNITWNYSTGYYPQANGLAEAFNKTLGKILKKTITKN